MKKYFTESIKIVKANYAFIVVLAALNATCTFAKTGNMTLMRSAFIISPIFISIIIYGRFTQIITGEQRKSFLRIFKKHWFNFFITVFVLGGCMLVLTHLFRLLFSGQIKAISWFAGGLINILTIYVLPIVFLKHHNIGAIPLGITYLFKNFKYTLPLLLLTLLTSVVGHLSPFFVVLFSKSNLFLIVAFSFINSFLLYFIDFTVFVTASIILVKEFLITPVKMSNREF